MTYNLSELEGAAIESQQSGLAHLTFIEVGDNQTQNLLVVTEDLFSQVFHYVTTTFGLQDGAPYRLDLDVGIVWAIPVRQETRIGEFDDLNVECCGYTVITSMVIGRDDPLEVQSATCGQEDGEPPMPLCDDCGGLLYAVPCAVCEWIKAAAETGGC